MNKLEAFYELTDESLKNLIKGCELVAENAKKVRTAKRDLIIIKSRTDEEAQKLDMETNPENYFSFKIFKRGVEIIYTNNFYDEETKTWYKNKKQRIYAIKYYNGVSNLFNNKEGLVEYQNRTYGQYKDLKTAIIKYKEAVVDILSQTGVIGLDPVNFAIYNN